MLTNVEAVGADMRFLGSLGAPSLRVSRMTIAGA
jgi:predicted Zn-dependent protease